MNVIAISTGLTALIVATACGDIGNRSPKSNLSATEPTSHFTRWAKVCIENSTKSTLYVDVNFTSENNEISLENLDIPFESIKGVYLKVPAGDTLPTGKISYDIDLSPEYKNIKTFKILTTRVSNDRKSIEMRCEPNWEFKYIITNDRGNSHYLQNRLRLRPGIYGHEGAPESILAEYYKP